MTVSSSSLHSYSIWPFGEISQRLLVQKWLKTVCFSKLDFYIYNYIQTTKEITKVHYIPLALSRGKSYDWALYSMVTKEGSLNEVFFLFIDLWLVGQWPSPLQS